MRQDDVLADYPPTLLPDAEASVTARIRAAADRRRVDREDAPETTPACLLIEVASISYVELAFTSETD